MISINELRLGNWLFDYSGEYYPVSFVTFENYSIAKKMDVKPIPLTDTILETCGFKITNTIAEETSHLLPLHLQKESTGWYMRLRAGYVNKKPLLYLHELQNLYFAVTGFEIQIQL